MNNPVEKFITLRAKELPETARTRSGIAYSPSESTWSFRDGITSISIVFQRVPVLCTALIPGLKQTLIWYLENRAPGTAAQHFTKIITLLKELTRGRNESICIITPEDILAYKMSSVGAEFVLASLRSFLKRWVALGAPGVSKDVTGLLNKLLLRQSPIGVAVATLDPVKGPFTDIEFEAIQTAINSAYANNEIDTEDFLLSFLLMALGIRPAQLAALKCCDLYAPTEGQDGDFILMVPRAKQKDQLTRDECKPRRLATQIGIPLHRHVQVVRNRFAAKLSDPGLAPMFPQTHEVQYADSPGFEYHRTSGTLSAKIVKVFTRLRIPSERLAGRHLSASAIRFRRTFATRAAEEGLPLLVIAELMDHADTRYVSVYGGLTTRIRAQFSRKIAMQMAPLAQAFSGRIIESETDATRPERTSRIIDLRIDQSGGAIGSCGTYAHCDFDKPISCYACPSFEPWIDGPHEAMLDFMLERRERQIKTTDARLASINDRAILGCAQVILHVRKLKKGKKRRG